MTTRLKGLRVAFEKDIREDDARSIIGAIGMLRGVLTVKPIEAESDDCIIEDRIRQEFSKRLWKALQKDLPTPR